MPKRRARALAGAIALSCLLMPQAAGSAVPGSAPAAAGNYDIRINGRGRLAVLRLSTPPPAAIARGMRDGLQRLRRASPGTRARFSPLMGAAEKVIARSGGLSPVDRSRRPADITLGYLRDHADLYGLAPSGIDALEILGESRGASPGLLAVRLRQRLDGRPVFQSETWVTLDGDGRVLATTGRLVPGLGAFRARGGTLLGATEALARALADLGVTADASTMEAGPAGEGWDAMVRVNNPAVTRPVPSLVVWFPVAPGICGAGLGAGGRDEGPTPTGTSSRTRAAASSRPARTSATVSPHSRRDSASTRRPGTPRPTARLRRPPTWPRSAPAPSIPRLPARSRRC